MSNTQFWEGIRRKFTAHHKFTTTYMRNMDLATSNRYNLYGGDNSQVDVKVNPCVEDVEVLITAEKKTQFVNDLVEVIWDFDKHTVTTLTGYIDNRAYIIKVADILRIFALNQKVYIQTANAEFLIKYRLYEIEDVLRKQKFLRISNSEIVNIRKIADIDLSIIGRVCIRLSGDICVYVSRRYIPKIKKSLGI